MRASLQDPPARPRRAPTCVVLPVSLVAALAVAGCGARGQEPGAGLTDTDSARSAVSATPFPSAMGVDCGPPPRPLPAAWPSDPPHFLDRPAVRELLVSERFDELFALLQAVGDSARFDARLEDAVVTAPRRIRKRTSRSCGPWRTAGRLSGRLTWRRPRCG
jgi:hypothetical protein